MPLFLVFSLLLLCCSGCASRIPEPIVYPYSQQQKMEASHHWQVLAADLADRINNELIATDNINTAVTVKQTCGDDAHPCRANETSSFNEAFHDLLVTSLVGFGIPTRPQADEDTLQINYKVQTVRHSTNRLRSLQPGVLTGISAAILVLRNAPSELVNLAIGTSLDVVNANLTTQGHYEVIVTTSVRKGNSYLFRASDIYYINDKDFWHYQEQFPETATLRLSSSSVEKAKEKNRPLPTTVPRPANGDEKTPQAPTATQQAPPAEPAPLPDEKEI